MSVVNFTIYNFETPYYKVKIDVAKSKCSLEYKHSHKTSYFKSSSKYEIIFERVWFGSLKNNLSIDNPKFNFDEKDTYETLLFQVAPTKYIHVYSNISEFDNNENIHKFFTIKTQNNILNYGETRNFTVLMFNLVNNFSFISINNSYKNKFKTPFDIFRSMKEEDTKLIPKNAYIPIELID